MKSKPITKEVKVSKDMYRIEIHPALVECEICPHDYDVALYAFRNKEKLNKIIKDNYFYESK